MEFTYNNSYQASIRIAPYEAFYRRPCRLPLCWIEVGESFITGPGLIRGTSEKVSLIRQRLLTAQSRQKSYADVYRAFRDTREGRHCCVPVGFTPSMSGVHEVFHVSILRKYTPDPTYVEDWGQIEVDTDGTFEEGLVCILDSRDQVLRCKTVSLVRVLWQHYGVEESTWESEDTMRVTYLF